MEASRSVKQALMLATDLVLIPTAFVSAILLRTEFDPAYINLAVISAFLVSLVVSILFFIQFGLYRAVVRFMSTEALTAVCKGVGVSVLVLAVMLYALHANLPRSVPIIYGLVLLLLIGGSRFLARAYINSDRRQPRKSVAIYGAGRSGLHLLSSLRASDNLRVVALLDDSTSLHGALFGGVQVYSPACFDFLQKKYHIEEVLLAVPSAGATRRREILEQLEDFPVHVKTIPSLNELISGEAKVDQVRDVDVEDLLGREPVKPDVELLQRNITGRHVLVTGAGGSIGSELCRQILANKPSVLVLFERNEYALYNLERELRAEVERQEPPQTQLVALLGCVLNPARLQDVLEAFSIETLYHAAAFKHVPLVESNASEGVRNNVIGTLNVAQAARRAGVGRFVLVSTDKAVRPTNVMGASKRLSEMVLQALATLPGNTCFSMVRFGNVLGSSGSVVPLFREQIRHGGPVTVTHPDIIRYFMTIPEAAQLVIQAGAMAKGGDVFVLDMGEPVKIADLARTMIRLMGFTVKEAGNPQGQIEVAFTGLRPGEKLFEELLVGEDAQPTRHPRILKAHEQALPWAKLEGYLVELDKACQQGDCERVRELLLISETHYRPSEQVIDVVWQHSKKYHKVLQVVDRFLEKSAQKSGA